MNKKWICFSFDNLKTETEPIKSNVAKKDDKFQNAFIKNSETFTNVDITDVLEPKTIQELAIHPKKVKEVETWLQDNLFNTNKRNESMLLLSGPSGCGKTITLKVLSRSMGIKLSEWINPIDKDFEMYRGPGQTARLTEFLTDSKYPSLLCSDINSKKITLVKDFPNSVIHNPSEFVGVLEKCRTNQNSAIVFICTEVRNNNLNLANTLFPQEVRDNLNITNISFNSCSETVLKNALSRAQTIARQHGDVVRIPSASTVEAIIATSMGDLRNAVNQYCFACLKGTDDLPTTNIAQVKGMKRKRNKKFNASVKSMERDCSLGLFHGLGRVLNPKRIESNNSWRLDCNLDTLIDEFSTQPGNFSAFLHENYLKYFGDLNDVCKSAEILSLSQIFLEKWTSQNEVPIFALWLSVFGLMVFNEHKVSKWNQITGPTRINKRVDNTLETRGLSPMDYCFYNIITETNKFHTVNKSFV